MDLNALGQVIDTTWTRSSTAELMSKSVKTRVLSNNSLLVCYTTVVTFLGDRQLVEQKREHEKDAATVVSKYLSEIKSGYKELTGKALKLKEVDRDVDIEVISMNSFSKHKKAYIRFNTTLAM